MEVLRRRRGRLRRRLPVAGTVASHIGRGGGGWRRDWVRQVRVRVMLRGQRLLPRSAVRDQLPLLGVSPLHPAILEPDLHLKENGSAQGIEFLN